MILYCFSSAHSSPPPLLAYSPPNEPARGFCGETCIVDILLLLQLCLGRIG